MRPRAGSWAGKQRPNLNREAAVADARGDKALPYAPALAPLSQAERAVQVEAARRGQLRRGREVLRPIFERVAHRAQQQLVRACLALLHRLDQRKRHGACRTQRFLSRLLVLQLTLVCARLALLCLDKRKRHCACRGQCRPSHLPVGIVHIAHALCSAPATCQSSVSATQVSNPSEGGQPVPLGSPAACAPHTNQCDRAESRPMPECKRRAHQWTRSRQKRAAPVRRAGPPGQPACCSVARPPRRPRCGATKRPPCALPPAAIITAQGRASQEHMLREGFSARSGQEARLPLSWQARRHTKHTK